MQHKIRHTIRMRISLIAVSFSLFIVVFLSTLSFSFFQNYARRNLIQSTEFNLQLIAGTMRQKLTDLDMLTRWCVTSSLISEWLTDIPQNTMESIRIHDRLREAIWNNRSNSYIRRLIVTDASRSKLLQVVMTESWPVTPYNLPKLNLTDYSIPSVFRTCTPDPYSVGRTEPVIPVVRPIYRAASKDLIGYVYLSVSVNVLLDQYGYYPMPSDCSLYLTFPDSMYRIDGNGFSDMTITSSVPVGEVTLNPLTVVREIRTEEGGSNLLVTYPIGIEGLYLSQNLSPSRLRAERMLYVLILGLISIAVILFGVSLSFLMNRIITRPVLKLQDRIDAIARSDFTTDPEIEWDDELGDIGRGINEMSGKIVSLLESRLADEKKKRDLEYRMLQSQINPHFLYNTLNSIKWMATIQKATGIAEMTTALSRLMKNVIKGSKTIVTLKEELALLDDYFIIQQYRYGGAIVFEKNIPEYLEQVPIPCFSLQPLMENAIFHGIEPRGGAGKISLSASLTLDGAARIVMEDDGVGMTEEQITLIMAHEDSASSSEFFKEIGIASVDKRIRYTFGREYGLRLESVPGAGTRAVLSVPYQAVGSQFVPGCIT